MIIIYVTCKDKREAKKISKHLIDKKLIACGNILESNSIYNWKGKLCNESESILLLKTRTSCYSDVKSEIKKIHSYETPCILRINVEAELDYKKWVNGQV